MKNEAELQHNVPGSIAFQMVTFFFKSEEQQSSLEKVTKGGGNDNQRGKCSSV